MSTAVPALPPRSATVGASNTTFGLTKDCPCYTPAALLTHLEKTLINSEEGHQHQFICFEPIKSTTDDDGQDAQQEPESTVQMIDIAFSNEGSGMIESTPVIPFANGSNALVDHTSSSSSTTTTTSRFVCRSCHMWLSISATQPTYLQKQDNRETHTCSAFNYLCHHYHAQALGSSYECCGCHNSVSVEWQEPILSPTLLKALQTTRKKAMSFAELMQAQDKKPTLVTTLTTLLVYLNDLLSGVKRNINSNNPHFTARIGLDQTSKALMECIGYRMNEEQYFMPPSVETTEEKIRLQQIQQELIMSLQVLRQELGETTVPIATGEQNIHIKENALSDLLGVIPSLERVTISHDNDTYINNAYAYFGLTPTASDTLVAWIYEKYIDEPTILVDDYEAMDNLVKIATHQSQSETLQTLVVCERSKGRIGHLDVSDAYAYFGITPEAAEDVELLKGLYRLKVADEPAEKNNHQEKLKVIAIARNSSEIFQFLKQEKGITASMSDAAAESLMGVPSYMMNQQPKTPVGLNNIGNTCYFNSLLQYYNALIPFRETIINNEEFIESEHSEPKKIGNIVVDQSEIRRAKKFVELLKELFLNLQCTSERAISPQYDLAFMALLNEREVEDEDEDKENKPPVDDAVVTETAAQSSLEDTEDKAQDKVSNNESLPIEAVINTDIPNVDKDDELMTDDKPFEMQTAETNSDRSIFLDPQPAQSQESDSYNMVPDELPPSYEESQADHPPVVVSDVKDKSLFSETTAPAPSAPLLDATVPKQRLKKEKPSVDSMLFGRQQDVTECMSNVMFLVEAALKPLSKTEDGEQIDDMVRQLFYGKARQILTYHDDAAQKKVTNEMEEDFSHVIVDASESKDLYDGLDEYFFAQRVENFQGGREAVREVAVKSFPPVLQILVQRVQFDRATANVYKSNAFIQFDKAIYLDRYADKNFERLTDKRAQVGQWRAELEKNRKLIEKYTKSQNTKLSVPELLETTRQMLQDLALNSDDACNSEEELAKVLEVLEKERDYTQQKMADSKQKIAELKERIQHQYDDCQELAYKLHAVFIHQGQANYGHYWIYILDHKENQWWKYNDSQVTKVQEQEVLHDTTGSTANPYFLVYVDANKLNELVETVIPK